MLTRYKGNYKIDTDVSFLRSDGKPAGCVALVAPHGAGKSSVLEGIELALTGTVTDDLQPSGCVPVTSLGAWGAYGARPVTVHVTGTDGHAGAVLASRRLTGEGSGPYADGANRAQMALLQRLDERLLSGKAQGSAAYLAGAFGRLLGESGTDTYRVEGAPDQLDETKLASDHGSLTPDLSGVFRKVSQAAVKRLMAKGSAGGVDRVGAGAGALALQESDILAEMTAVIDEGLDKTQVEIRELRKVIATQAEALSMISATATYPGLSADMLSDLERQHAALVAWERTALQGETTRFTELNDQTLAAMQADVHRLGDEVVALETKLAMLRDAGVIIASQRAAEVADLVSRAESAQKRIEQAQTTHEGHPDRVALVTRRTATLRVAQTAEASLTVARALQEFAATNSPAAKVCPLTGRPTDPSLWTEAVVRCAARAEKASARLAADTAALEAYDATHNGVLADLQQELTDAQALLAATKRAQDERVSENKMSVDFVTASFKKAMRDLEHAKAQYERLAARLALRPTSESAETLTAKIRYVRALVAVSRDTASEALEIDRKTAQIERMKAVRTFCVAAAKAILDRLESKVITRIADAAQRAWPVDATLCTVAVERSTQSLVFGLRVKKPDGDEYFVPYEACSGQQRVTLKILLALATANTAHGELLLDDDDLGGLNDDAFGRMLDLLVAKQAAGEVSQVILASARLPLFGPESTWAGRSSWLVVTPQRALIDAAQAKRRPGAGPGGATPGDATDTAADDIRDAFDSTSKSVTQVDADIFADMF